jgi:hypothetical protein
LGNLHPLSRRIQVRKQLTLRVLYPHQGAYRYGQGNVFSILTVLELTEALLTFSSLVTSLIPVCDESIDVEIADKIDAAAIATVPTIRPSPGHVLFVTATDSSVPTMAAYYMDNYTIYHMYRTLIIVVMVWIMGRAIPGGQGICGNCSTDKKGDAGDN